MSLQLPHKIDKATIFYLKYGLYWTETNQNKIQSPNFSLTADTKF
jgi:hypothetical protein